MKRDLESGKPAARRKRAIRVPASTKQTGKSVAVLYFENLSGAKEDEYLRDGITEDVITELSKIRGLNTFSRPTVLAFRDKPVTPAQIGQQLGAAYVLTGTLRRAGARLRISAQLVDTHTDFPLWSERFDREMKDVFEVQDEMARKIAEALRVTLSPQELEALAVKPTENLQAYDLYLRGKRYARRQTRQDLEFAPADVRKRGGHGSEFRPGLRRLRQRLRHVLLQLQPRRGMGRTRARSFRQSRGPALGPARSAGQPGLGPLRRWTARRSPCAWSKRPSNANATARARITCCAAPFSRRADTRKSWTSRNPLSKRAARTITSYVPILNSLGAMGKDEGQRNMARRAVDVRSEPLETGARGCAGARPAGRQLRHIGRVEDALRELNLAVTLRANEASILYNAACVYCATRTGRRRRLILCARPGKRDFRMPCGRAAIRSLGFFTAIRSLSACTQQSPSHRLPPVPTSSSRSVQTRVASRPRPHLRPAGR